MNSARPGRRKGAARISPTLRELLRTRERRVHSSDPGGPAAELTAREHLANIIQPPATSGDGADQARPALELFGADVASRSPNEPLYPGGQRSAGHSTWCR